MSAVLPESIRPWARKHALGREFLGYFAASAAGLAVDTLVLVALVEFGAASYLWAAVAGFLAGVAVVYLLSVALVFSHRRIKSRRAEFPAFVLLGLVGLGTTLLVMWLGVERFGLDYRPVKLVAAGVGFLINFGLRKLFLFSHAS